MLQINRILCPTDFSESARQALDHALFLTGESDAELHLMHVVELGTSEPHDPAYSFPDITELANKVRTAARKRMKEDVEPLEDQEVIIKTHESRGVTAAFSILEYAREIDSDLIVCGSSGRLDWDLAILGSTSSRIVRYSKCPVMTVHENRISSVPDAMEKILVPYDFSDYSKTALEHAVALADTYGARLDLLHVVDIRKYPDFYMKNNVQILIGGVEDIGKRAGRRLEEVAEGVRDSIDGLGKVQAHVRGGRTYEEINRFAQDVDADLIVIATHGLTGFRGVLLGSVAEQVTQNAPCPVFAVKPFGKSLLQGR